MSFLEDVLKSSGNEEKLEKLRAKVQQWIADPALLDAEADAEAKADSRAHRRLLQFFRGQLARLQKLVTRKWQSSNVDEKWAARVIEVLAPLGTLAGTVGSLDAPQDTEGLLALEDESSLTELVQHDLLYGLGAFFDPLKCFVGVPKLDPAVESDLLLAYGNLSEMMKVFVSHGLRPEDLFWSCSRFPSLVDRLAEAHEWDEYDTVVVPLIADRIEKPQKGRQFIPRGLLVANSALSLNVPEPQKMARALVGWLLNVTLAKPRIFLGYHTEIFEDRVEFGVIRKKGANDGSEDDSDLFGQIAEVWNYLREPQFGPEELEARWFDPRRLES